MQIRQVDKVIKFKYYFKLQFQDNEHLLRSSLTFFKSTYHELMEKYCNIIDQIPADYFNGIGGFESSTFLQLKIMRQKFKAKTKLLQNNLEKRAEQAKAQREQESKLQNDNYYDDLEEEERQMQEEQKNISKVTYENGPPDDEEDLVPSTSNANIKKTEFTNNNYLKQQEDMRLREELIHDFCEEDDDDEENNYLARTMLDDEEDIYGKQPLNDNKTENANNNNNQEDDCELDDLLNDIEDENAILQGRKSDYNRYSYRDFEEKQVKTAQKQTAAQRITFPIDETETLKLSTSIDEDGWQVCN